MTDRQVKNLIERIYLSQHDQEKREALKIVYQAFLDSTIHPTRKTGKWVSNGVEAFGVVEYWVCDQCYDQSKYRTNFCPSCGARMDGDAK